MTEPAVPEPAGIDLAQALRRAFDEAGDPSLAVVHAASGVAKQRLSDWRAGRHVPARLEDLEPVIAYLHLAATSVPVSEADDANVGVTDWTPEHWHAAWRRSVDLPASTRNVVDLDATELAPEVDRKPVAIAVVSIIVILVAALAVTAFLFSLATM